MSSDHGQTEALVLGAIAVAFAAAMFAMSSVPEARVTEQPAAADGR